jgi:hypothetical protein
MNTQISSDVRTQLGSVMRDGSVSLWTRPLTPGQSFGEDSRFFPESEFLPQGNLRTGCVRGILWAFGLQGAVVILAVMLFKIFYTR